MNKNFIQELNKDTTYLDLRILTYLECEEKMKKISHILGFLQQNNFLVNLTMIYYENMRAENMFEHQDIPSLTIDMRDGKFRFKYWDGSKTYWTYHVDDLTSILVVGREEYSELNNKYKPITDLLFKIRDEHENIKFVRYKYYPESDIDIQYEVQFFRNTNTNIIDIAMKDIFKEIDALRLSDLRMDIDYSLEKKCIPCEKAKEKQK